MLHEKKARPAVGSKGRANDLTINSSLPRAVEYDTVRDDKSKWDRGCLAVAAAFVAMTAIYAVGLAIGVFN